LERLEGKTFNVVQDNIEKLKELFPEAFTENKVDIDKLRLTLGEHVEMEKERYEFTWNGKTEAIKLAQKQTTGTLRPCKEESVEWETSQNLYIEGDNLEVLRILQNSYRNKVKMIYIDPPYNTGKDFVYKDSFQDNLKSYKEMNLENYKTNAETNGRFHTEWLNLMYPRLKVARSLLTEDGVIFISIDENEQHNLKKVCDEIFGEHNFITEFVWRKRTGSNDSINLVSIDHEVIVCYGKSNSVVFNGVEKAFENYKNPDNDPRGDWMADNLTCNKTASERPNLYYPITDPKTGITYKCNPYRVWAYEKNRMKQAINEGKIIFPKKTDGTPMYKRFKNEVKSTHKPFSSIIEAPINSVATKELREILGGHFFDFPKSTALIEKLVDQATDSDSLVLDFFSGSSTTAHAVLNQNIADGGKRKFIMVQLPEKTIEGTGGFEAGYKNICEIGKERIRRSGKKIKEEQKEKAKNLDIGFKVFKLDETNLKVWNQESMNLEKDLLDLIEPIKEGRTKEDVVYEILLKYGVNLTVPVQELTVNGRVIFSVGMGYLFICLEKDLTLEDIEEISKKKPSRVVFYDEGFNNDTVRTNAQQILKRYGVDDIRVI